MRVLVTGSEGFIGKAVCEALHKAGHAVMRYDLKFGDTNNIRYGNFPTSDVIVHLASLIDIKESFEKPADYYLTNTIGTGMLPYKRVVFASSAAVYGEPSPYAHSKALAERLLPPHSLILRIFNPFGPNERHSPETHLIPNLMTGNATIYKGGTQVRNFVWLKDVADAFVKAVDSPQITGTFDLCSDYPLSVNEVIDLMDVEVKEIDQHRRDAGDVGVLKGDNSALKEALNWEPSDPREHLKDWRNW